MQARLNVRAPAADGVELATDVYRPDGPGPHAAILIRTPYHRSTGEGFSLAHVNRFIAHGYAAVVQDVRGKFDSDGVVDPVFQEAADGQAALDWVANQRWCNGRIGMWGPSYLSMVQVPAAAGGHPALKAIAPSVGPANFFRDWVRYDGCFALYNAVRWGLSHASMRCRPSLTHFKWLDLCRAESLDALANACGTMAPCLRDWAAQDRDGPYWARADHGAMYARVDAAGHHAGGWFDHVTRGQFDDFRGLRDGAATNSARSSQYLFIGPWGHITTLLDNDLQTRFGDWQFGPAARASMIEEHMAFFDRFVGERADRFENQPAAKIFLMGANRWVHLPEWPPGGGTRRLWHLGEGVLSEDAPVRATASTVTHNPRDPVPTRGGPVYWGCADIGIAMGPVDQRPLMTRRDVRHYRGPPLPAPLTVMGEPAVRVAFSSDVEDADVIVKLCVELPDGPVVCLTYGQLRCRFRHGFDQPAPLARGQVDHIRVRLHPLAYQFPAGARMVLLVMHSDFPRIDSHPGTMDPPLSGATPRIAAHTVHHDPVDGSVLELPVIEGL